MMYVDTNENPQKGKVVEESVELAPSRHFPPMILANYQGWVGVAGTQTGTFSRAGAFKCRKPPWAGT